MPSNVLIFPAPVCFYIERLFSAAKMARLKNTSKFALRKLVDDMCAFRARMQQSPKLIFCSTVAF